MNAEKYWKIKWLINWKGREILYLISVKSALFVFNMDRNSVLEKNLIEISNVIIVNPFRYDSLSWKKLYYW